MCRSFGFHGCGTLYKDVNSEFQYRSFRKMTLIKPVGAARGERTIGLTVHQQTRGCGKHVDSH